MKGSHGFLEMATKHNHFADIICELYEGQSVMNLIYFSSQETRLGWIFGNNKSSAPLRSRMLPLSSVLKQAIEDRSALGLSIFR